MRQGRAGPLVIPTVTQQGIWLWQWKDRLQIVLPWRQGLTTERLICGVLLKPRSTSYDHRSINYWRYTNQMRLNKEIKPSILGGGSQSQLAPYFFHGNDQFFHEVISMEGCWGKAEAFCATQDCRIIDGLYINIVIIKKLITRLLT